MRLARSGCWSSRQAMTAAQSIIPQACRLLNQSSPSVPPTNGMGSSAWTLGNRAIGGSNFGPEINVAAPGVSLHTTDRTGRAGYCAHGNYTASYGGTSGAAAVVAGAAALILSAEPDLSPQDVRDRLQGTAEDLGDPGFDAKFGHGRIDICRALRGSQLRKHGHTFADTLKAETRVAETYRSSDAASAPAPVPVLSGSTSAIRGCSSNRSDHMASRPSRCLQRPRISPSSPVRKARKR